MAMGGIDDKNVDAGSDKPFGPLKTIFTDARCGGDAQPALRILGCIRVKLRLPMSLTVIRPTQ